MDKQNGAAFSERYREQLRVMLTRLLGPLAADAFEHLLAQFDWIEYDGGEQLFAQGDPPDAAYFLVAGRLRALRQESSGQWRLLGDIRPGETVGEVAVLSESVRTASVIAARDSIVVRIAAACLREWFIAYPPLLLNTARLVINRANRGYSANRRDAQVSHIAVVALTPQVDLAHFRQHLQRALTVYGTTLMLDASEVDAKLGVPGIANADKDSPHRYWKLSDWLAEQSERFTYVIYIADRDNDAWSQRCVRQADRLLLLADARDDCTPSSYERALAEPASQRLIANTFLALLHPAETRRPSDTRRWLQPRPWVSEPLHVRDDDDSHMARLARLLTGHAIGLVLGSGGARGLAHVGIYRALRERGIAVDRIGGTSIGAVLGACIASDWDADELERHSRSAFGQNPTTWRDLNWLPILSLFRGQRLRRLLNWSFPDEMAIEDLWLPFFCVSSDIAANREVVHTRGPLARCVRASAALPGVFPVVRLNDGLHVDGAFMNALPVDVMGRLGVAKIIAVDLGFQLRTELDFDEVPGSFAYLLDRFWRGKKRRYRVPTLVSIIIQSSLLASEAKDAQARRDADLLFSPDVRRFELINWAACDKLIAIGYQHAREVLAAHPGTSALLPPAK